MSNISLETRLVGKEQNVLDSIVKNGIPETMELFGVKTRSSFRKWVLEHGGTITPAANLGLDERLAGKEKDVLISLREKGVSKTMEAFGIKSLPSFQRWVLDHRDGVKIAVPELKGGAKQLWLRQHRQTILDCYDMLGEAFCLETFHLEPETLEKLVKPSSNHDEDRGLTLSEQIKIFKREVSELRDDNEKMKLEIQILITNDAEQTRAYKEMVEFFQTFKQNVAQEMTQALVGRLLEPLQRSTQVIEQPRQIEEIKSVETTRINERSRTCIKTLIL